ncbi:thiamine-phosphate kinase [Hippea alviniae]|uniref:thiamine-phosphate kinase n=1 Tax=Hippea alviniae TaxID=1279027 RepID=UPI0003B53F60|nr:thiamine-phosphate kinase [Hippea alviniae]
MNISDIGEFGLIEEIKRLTKNPEGALGIGDDCAIIEYGEKELLVSVDALVEGVHFFEDANPYLLGRKSLAVNISDVAAMAGIPKWCFLSISIGKGVAKEWIDSFMKGFLDLAEEYNVYLLGGDTTSSEKTVINITIIGENRKGKSLKRSTAKVGDLVVVSGRIGCSFAGFKALRDSIEGFEELKDKHLNPKPMVEEALKIRDIATAMIDISDGLVQDCGHIAESSKVKIELFWDKIPFCDTDIATEEEMLCGGEDYQILATIRSNAGLPDGFYVIGRVVKGEGVVLLKNGKSVELKDCGYRHF